MKVIVGLVPDSVKSEFSIGDEVRLQIVIDEKVGSAGEKWKVATTSNARWLVVGDVTVDTQSFASVPSDGGLTKIEGTAIVHQVGKVTVGDLALENSAGTKIQATGQVLEAKPSAMNKTEEPVWTLPPVRFGGWSGLALLIVALVILGIIGLFTKQIIDYLRKKKLLPEKTFDELAFQNLEELSKKFSKKTNLDLAEWKHFSYQLVKILRSFTDANFRTASHDLTDREFLEMLSSTSVKKPDLDRVRKILTTLDEVRYGTKKLSTELVPEMVQETRAYLQNTLQKESKK